jgi:hypothetical protein
MSTTAPKEPVKAKTTSSSEVKQGLEKATSDPAQQKVILEQS